MDRPSGSTTSTATCSTTARMRDLIERGRHQRRDLEPDDLREGHGPLGPLRRRLPRARRRDQRPAGDLRAARPARRPRRRRPAARRSSSETEGQDGYVSFELPAVARLRRRRARSTQAQRLRELIDRDNVLIKVPGHRARACEAFEELTARGVNVNVTLLFAVERYQEIAEAYVRGLERRAGRRRAGRPRRLGGELLRVARGHQGRRRAGASSGREDLRGKAAVANARIAYASFQEIFSGERWERLRAGRRERAAPAVGLHVDQEPRLPGHALRRRADRPGHRQHDARRDDRGRARPRDGRAHGRPGRRRRARS